MIPFNKPYLSGNEIKYIKEAIEAGHISGNGKYSRLCHRFFEGKFGFKKCLLTTSCTDALEMAALLINIKAGDEIIVPSYSFVSTANAFALHGAKIVFADSRPDHPNLDEQKIESLITKKTKAIVVVHYAGIACDMDKIKLLADNHNLFVIEDAALSINSFYKNKPLGGIGNFGCFSFHETKNIQCGEGGMLVVNDDRFIDRSEIIWEKGTNRSAFFRGEISKYEWIDLGSSFLPSELISAYLYAQLENLESIQKKRLKIWENYFNELLILEKAGVLLPIIPNYSSNNGHIFYLICKTAAERDELLKYLNEKGINAVFHYQSLNKSVFIKSHSTEITDLPNSDLFSSRLIRLPLYHELTEDYQNKVISTIKYFYNLT